ncbi:hypothetical protein SCUCBS95973_006501 [Sporothrix curviconia]|uniref:Cas1p 10 TM acyl transferase domain-containing protein n=1 Tax=Sporothrix curviconia TaxID=1260050 RepID=A0ABP0C5Q2_9PEZI
MGLAAPLHAASRVARLVGGTVRGMLNVGHAAANAVVCLSAALFCIGLVLQGLSNAADPYRCGALVRHGSWPPYTPPKADAAADYEQLETLQRQGREPPPARPFDKWEPAGCRMHEYSRDDIRACLGGKRVLFVGDSTMRVLFLAALTRLEHEAAEWLLRTTFIEQNPRHDLAIDSETVQLQFIWDPWLNSTAFEAEMRHFEPRGGKDVDPAGKPDLVIVGSAGLWAARNAADSLYFDAFRASTDRVTRVMGDTVKPFGRQKTDNYVFLAPVQIPRYELLLPDRAEALAPERIMRMNSYLASLSPAVQSHVLTAYNDMTYHVPEAYEDTGLHVSDAVAERWIDIPLNARCNGMLLGRPAKDQPAPSMAHAMTCCAAYPEPVRGQKILRYGIFAAVLVQALILLLRNRAATLPSHLGCVFIGPALLYCYMADRSHAFAKIFASATVLIYVLLRSGTYGFFETVGCVGQRLFGGPTTWDVEKMRVAVQADWCAPFAGMVVAVFAQRVAIVCDRMQRQQQNKQRLLSGQRSPLPGRPRTKASSGFTQATFADDTNVRNSVSKDACFLDRLIIAILYPGELMAPVQTMVVIFSGVFFFGFASATTVSPVLDGGQPHPYLTTVAVVCFAVVRNAHSQLRAAYMALPAALGAMALELHVLRNHILLSGNGTGHLRLLSIYSIYPRAMEDGGGSFGEHLTAAKVAAAHCLEIASIATIFLAVSWHTHRSTRMLSAMLFGEKGAEAEEAKCVNDSRVLAKEAAEGARARAGIGLPQHNGDITSSMSAGSSGPSTSSTALRAGGVLLFFWGVHRWYL